MEAYPWLKESLDLINKGQDQNGIMVLMENLDDMMHEGRFEEIDQILEQTDPETLPIDYTMTFLTMLWHTWKRTKFAKYAARCRTAYTRLEPKNVEGLMKGFEDLDNQPKSPFIYYTEAEDGN